MAAVTGRSVNFSDNNMVVELATSQDGEVEETGLDGLENGNGFEEGGMVKERRVIRKAKRLTVANSSGGEGVDNGVDMPAPSQHPHVIHSALRVPPFSKNSRRSRNGRGRGLPKKGRPWTEFLKAYSRLQCLFSCLYNFYIKCW